jgi:hypothetical protein
MVNSRFRRRARFGCARNSTLAVGLGDGCALLRVGLAERLRTPPAADAPPVAADPASPTVAEPHDDSDQVSIPATLASYATGLSLSITATEDDPFTLSQALSKLRGLLGDGGSVELQVEVRSATAGEPIDRLKARNTVVEPLGEDEDVTLQWQWTGQAR